LIGGGGAPGGGSKNRSLGIYPILISINLEIKRAVRN